MGRGWGRDPVEVGENAPVRVREEVAVEVVNGAFARVIHGTGEVTDGLDITPSLREENLARLQKALNDLEASRPDRRPLNLVEVGEPVLELDTRGGRLKLVPEPTGTRGYDDLRRHASRESLDQGMRPQVASSGDLARMLSALPASSAPTDRP